ncbi:unnamed protein product [Larinioides sclopetarius]|uniref:Ribosomal protein S15 n=1 Tax=Larinioides sclopetarius TaxID=280406 RepID=A0AAV1ZNG0_9ARAC
MAQKDKISIAYQVQVQPSSHTVKLIDTQVKHKNENEIR